MEKSKLELTMLKQKKRLLNTKKWIECINLYVTKLYFTEIENIYLSKYKFWDK